MRVKQFWAYMLRCRDGSYYIGVTGDVNIRVAEHNAGQDPDSSAYTRRPAILVWSAVFGSPTDAIRVEKKLKGWSRAKKEALIRGDWAEIRRLARPSTSSG